MCELVNYDGHFLDWSGWLFSLCFPLQLLDCYVIDNHGFVLVSKQQNDVSALADKCVSYTLYGMEAILL